MDGRYVTWDGQKPGEVNACPGSSTVLVEAESNYRSGGMTMTLGPKFIAGLAVAALVATSCGSDTDTGLASSSVDDTTTEGAPDGSNDTSSTSTLTNESSSTTEEAGGSSGEEPLASSTSSSTTSSSTPSSSTTSSTTSPAAPRAPELPEDASEPGFEEQLLLITVAAGGEHILEGMELFSAPAGTPASCATSGLTFTWQVREPWPSGGEDLQIRRSIPFNQQTELVAEGVTGDAVDMEYCGSVTVKNLNLDQVKVEIRYVSWVLV